MYGAIRLADRKMTPAVSNPRSALAKVYRAFALCEELAASQAELRERQQQGPSTLLGENNAHAWNERTFWAQWTFQPTEAVPEEWAALIGDVLHNLRGALDHVVWHLACKNLGHEPEKPTQIMFPIATHRQKLTNRGPSITLASVGAGARTAIEAVQPFHSDAPKLHPLAILDYLSMRDKHRAVHVIRTAAYRVDVDVQPTPWDLRQMVAPGTFLEGDVVARIEYTRHHGDDVREVVIQPAVHYGESINIAEGTDYVPIGDVLQDLLDAVRGVLADMADYV